MPHAVKPVDDNDPSKAAPTAAEALAAQREGFDEAAQLTTQTPAATTQAAPTQDEVHAKAKSDKEAAAQVETEAKAKAKADEEAKAAELNKAGYTKTEVETMLKKQADELRAENSRELSKAFGKFGSLEQQVKALSEKAVGVQLTDEDVADIKAEYGPELAASLMKTLNKAFTKTAIAAKSAAAAPVVDTAAIEALETKYKADIEQAVGTTKTAMTKEFETKLLSLTHPDWKDVTGIFDKDGVWKSWQPGFKSWMDALPEADQKKIVSGCDAGFVSQKLTEYKAFGKTKADVAATQQQSGEGKKVPTRMAQGVQPTTQQVTATSTKSALDYQREGYASAM